MAEYSSDSIFNVVTAEAVEATLDVALLLIPAFILIEFGVSTVRYLGGNGDGWIDYKKAFLHVMVWCLCAQYMPIMTLVEGSVDAVQGMIEANISSDPALTVKAIESPEAYRIESGSQKAAEPSADPNAPKDPSDAEAVDWKGVAMKTLNYVVAPELIVKNTVNALVTSVFGIIASIVRSVVLGLSTLLGNILLVFGPLAIAFNMMPYAGEGVFKNWFTTWLSVKFWVLTISVLDFFFWKTIDVFINRAMHPVKPEFLQEVTNSTWADSLVGALYVILYIMVPYLTGLYVRGGGGQFLSLMVGAGAMIAKAGVNAAKMGAGVVK